MTAVALATLEMVTAGTENRRCLVCVPGTPQCTALEEVPMNQDRAIVVCTEESMALLEIQKHVASFK